MIQTKIKIDSNIPEILISDKGSTSEWSSLETTYQNPKDTTKAEINTKDERK